MNRQTEIKTMLNGHSFSLYKNKDVGITIQEKNIR